MMPKLILISNRLPLTVEFKKDNEIAYIPSTGGLATGLSSLTKTQKCVWIGFSGISTDTVDKHRRRMITRDLANNYSFYSVPLTSHDLKLYYNGFSNKTIWPLFHYFSTYTSFDTRTWDYYLKVNQKFFESFKDVYEPGDMIWVHDYHLMLLPGIIRKNIPDARIGFFLHIPFPSYELFRLLPWRKEILEGLLGSDLLGFHTFGYVRHFLNSVQRIIGLEHYLGQLQIENRNLKCDIFPMGIDYDKYSNYMHNTKIAEEIAVLKEELQGRKMILSMDRLDFTKGIISRLESFARFLKKYPEYYEKVVLVLLAVPSRTSVDTYSSLRDRVNEIVGRINGKYSTLNWSPIRYLYRSLPFETIMTLYHCADAALVTPLRDGMNLVAKEYVASRTREDGVLILSEMAGAAEELGEAIIVNPNNIEEMADAIALAISMGKEEQHNRISIMQRRLKRNDVFKWAESFIDKLNNFKTAEPESPFTYLDSENKMKIMDSYGNASARILFLDYDGTLVPFSSSPASAVPDEDLILLLKQLSSDKKNDVVLTSGRSQDFLEKYFSGIPLVLIAEHGAFIKMPSDEWKTLVSLNKEWKQQIRPLIELFSDRTPGSFVEEKEHSLVWHYRRSDAEFASIRAIELKSNLMHLIANLNLGIIEGNKVLEIKNIESNKGKIASNLITRKKHDFLLAIGDDDTDEELFSVLPDSAYSIKIGYGHTKANYQILNLRDIRMLLEEMTSIT
ncbi:MAG: bifunctional alpha,alpha-trehalose-phosphate synthase (UDP-forming)/trehalose-phosphatase [Spirochaetes bacterium]|nr:bifunctional alpha,alpha-trehalose-phosphate synthase (UDP-forming)/trehalose-phosphatase [Spirochaetota bacterium]